MPPPLALLLYILFTLYLFRMDSKRKPNVSRALWIPTIWVIVIAVKPISSWLDPEGTTRLVAANMYMTGNTTERNVYFLLIFAAFFILAKRKIHWSQIFRSNPWIFLFFLYCGISILWSEFPFVSFKRWVKTIGNLAIVLVVLTEDAPIEAVKTIIKRFSYLLIPLSIVLIKYYPLWGRYYNRWTWTVAYSGVSSDKNGLGYLCMVSGIFFFWDLFIKWHQKNTSYDKKINILFLLMISWLFACANSATSLVCFLLGNSILLFFSVIKNSKKYLGVYLFSIVCIFLFVHLFVDVYEFAISSLGRDSTLTGRLNLWEMVLGMVSDPLIGTGYESFWLGNRLNRLSMVFQSGVINQAHNGYIEIYLNLGIIGLFMLAAMIFSAYRKIRRALLFDFDFAKFRMAFLVVIILYNITEFAFKGFCFMFFIFLIISVDVPCYYSKQKGV